MTLRTDSSAANQGEQAEANLADGTVNDKCNDSIHHKDLPRNNLAYCYGSNDDSKQPCLFQPIECYGFSALMQAVPQGNHTACHPVIHLTDRGTGQNASDAKRLHQQQGNHNINDGAANGNIPALAEEAVCGEEGEAGILIDVDIQVSAHQKKDKMRKHILFSQIHTNKGVC